MPESGIASDAQGLIDQFAERLVRKTQPAPLPADYFSPQQIQARLAAALGERGTARNQAGYRTQARCCYAFLEAPEYTTAQLAAYAGKQATHTASRALARLAAAKLLTWKWRGHHRYWSLTAAGEQWLLKTAKGAAAQPPTAGEATAEGAEAKR